MSVPSIHLLIDGRFAESHAIVIAVFLARRQPVWRNA